MKGAWTGRNAMTEVSRRMDIDAPSVWAVLADGWLYTGWVVGTSHIRAVDDSWPAAGAKLQHAVGAWPMQIKGDTQVLESEPGRRLVLQARGWPAGEARVEITLVPAGGATVVTIAEKPTNGPGKWFDNPVQRKILEARNNEGLDRLDAMATGRAR